MLIELHCEYYNILLHCVGFEVLTVVVTNVAIFCDIAPCNLYVN
jgi:hypothetical protein